MQRPDVLAQLLNLRMTEMETREQIVLLVRDINEKKLWKELGFRSIRDFCEDELGYGEDETREILIQLALVVPASALVSDDPKVQDRIDRLKAWRKAESIKRGWAAFRILTNRVLLDIAKNPPVSADQLSSISGIGPKKIADFGPTLLEVLR